jgi:ubiquinone/menaquinone biosynthesis C-methylase UbiE
VSTQLHKKGELDVDDFITSSIIRFGGLRDYIQEKLTMDYFAIEGNMGLARGVRAYLQTQKSRLQAQKQIKILDVGPAIGSLSGMLVLQELAHAGLIGKAKLILLDVSERVIERTQSRDFPCPEVVIAPQFKNKILSKLRTSKGIVGSCEAMPIKDERIDISLAGFLFHHLHDKIKADTAQEIQRVTKPNGFIGIAEATFNNYNEYAATHRHDEIPLAYESHISYTRLRRLFPDIEVFESYQPKERSRNENFYYFCGIKKQKRKLGTSPRQQG